MLTLPIFGRQRQEDLISELQAIQGYTERHYIKDRKNKQNTKANSTGYEGTLSPSIQEAKEE